jgi:two-component system phosphate regulon sensor histidine kinase PhoR
MSFSRKKAGYLYFFIGVVMAGLIGIQVYWIWNSVRLQNLAIEKKLKEDVQKIVADVEDDAYCFSLNSKTYLKRNEGVYIVKQNWKDGKFVGPAEGGYLDTLNLYNVFYGQKDTFFINDHTYYVDSFPPVAIDLTMKFTFMGFNPHIKRNDTSSYEVSNLTADNFREVLANKFKVDEAINLVLLDSLVKKALVSNRLDTAYQAGIRKQGESVYEYLKPGSDTTLLANTAISAVFMNNNRFNKPYELLVYVPNSFRNVVSSLSAMMISSLVIILLLIISYAYFVRTILNQKKLSEMKNTFINNITHEFRTPITNINLAIENWKDAAYKNGVYMGVIEAENKRMERNVEQILQLAAIEHTNIKYDLSLIDMHELIKETAATFDIQLEKTKGELSFQFNAPDPYIYADKQQVRNLLFNLIDNSIKYSKEEPRIKIVTYSANNRFVLQVEDNGIGMPADKQKYIFNRFYRGHNGDTHDVKGFGLGLSYVKYIVDAHKGEIHVKSKPGAGTTFSIYLPKTHKL